MNVMNDAIKRIIESTVRDRFASETVHILDVTVSDDFDDFDQAIYSVTVIYEAPKGILDPDKTLGIVRHTRSRLAETNESGFPIFRFVSQSDAKKIGIAAA